jgi:transcriptional regulator with XRE-family HTH domain
MPTMAEQMTQWLALRLAAKISQREAERRMGWEKRGHLSLIERGVAPTPEQEADMKRLYAALLVAE